MYLPGNVNARVLDWSPGIPPVVECRVQRAYYEDVSALIITAGTR